jgi:hypothetical protein
MYAHGEEFPKLNDDVNESHNDDDDFKDETPRASSRSAVRIDVHTVCVCVLCMYACV